MHISDIINCIEKGEEPKSNGKNAIWVHRLIDALHESSHNDNKKVFLKEFNV